MVADEIERFPEPRAAHAAISAIVAGVVGVAWNTEMGNQFLRFHHVGLVALTSRRVLSAYLGR
jgi:hypothetical protein